MEEVKMQHNGRISRWAGGNKSSLEEIIGEEEQKGNKENDSMVGTLQDGTVEAEVQRRVKKRLEEIEAEQKEGECRNENAPDSYSAQKEEEKRGL